jgi:antitoxin component YwqK of YwqJK toxin-antitoxin module
MRNGLMDGLMARWHASGALAYCVAYQSGQKDGYEIGWFDTNPPQLKSSTQYRDGKLHGEMLRWAPNGQLLVEGEYFRGQAVGTWRYWNADGVFLGSYFLQNGTGKMRGWHDNGVLAWEGETEHGLEVGSWLFWNDKGELLGWCDYHDDGSANCEGETRGVSRPSLDETWREMQKRQ